MSYLVEIIRSIGKEEVIKLLAADREFEIVEEGGDWIDFRYVKDGKAEVFGFAQGRISVTSPSDASWEKARELATALGAEVIGEEDHIPVRTPVSPGIFAGRSTWIGWPIIVLVLFVMLLFK